MLLLGSTQVTGRLRFTLHTKMRFKLFPHRQIGDCQLESGMLPSARASTPGGDWRSRAAETLSVFPPLAASYYTSCPSKNINPPQTTMDNCVYVPPRMHGQPQLRWSLLCASTAPSAVLLIPDLIVAQIVVHLQASSSQQVRWVDRLRQSIQGRVDLHMPKSEMACTLLCQNTSRVHSPQSERRSTARPVLFVLLLILFLILLAFAHRLPASGWTLLSRHHG